MGTTHFLSVDLDVESRDELAPFINALGSQAFALSPHTQGAMARVSLELTSHLDDADSSLAKFVELIASLPSEVRSVWDRASVRDLNVGIQGGTEPHEFVTTLTVATLRAVADIGARVLFTVYRASSETEPA